MSINKSILERYEKVKEEQLQYQGKLSYNKAAREKIVADLTEMLNNEELAKFHNIIKEAIDNCENKEIIEELLAKMETQKKEREDRLEMLLR